MATNVVGLFESWNEAQHVVQDLVDGGFSRDNISIVANDAQGNLKQTGAGGTQAGEGATSGAVGGGVLGGVLGLLAGVGALAIPGIGPVIAAGPLAAALGTAGAGALVGAGAGAATGGLVGGLVGLGIPDNDAELYAEGIRRGGALVTVSTSEDQVDSVAMIMQQRGVIDIDERAGQWRSSGWTRFDHSAEPYTHEEITAFSTTRPTTTTTRTETTTTTPRNRDTNREGEVLEVVEEELTVGKRQVQRGGVRIHTVVEERPVEEQVRLREERVHVERRPVDRELTNADMSAFKEASFEVTETGEEAVVAKRTRVIEEVVVRKDVEERTETVRDTVRRQDVVVDETVGDTVTTGTASTTSVSGFDTYNNDFQTHFTGLGTSGYTYDQYQPVYRYGYDLANDRRYAGRDWTDVEADARTSWEERNPNSWEDFKDSVRYAWDRARGKR